MELMAAALMEYETIDSSQIDEIMEGKKPSPPKDWEPPQSKDDGDSSDPVKMDSASPDSMSRLPMARRISRPK